MPDAKTGPPGHDSAMSSSNQSVRWQAASLIPAGALLAGALGVGILWVAGQSFPVYPPPGMAILAVGAVVVAVVRSRWVPLVAVALGLFIVVGFVLSSVGSGTGTDNLLGVHGVGRVVGQAVELIGVVVAAIAGARATYRSGRPAIR